VAARAAENVGAEGPLEQLGPRDAVAGRRSGRQARQQVVGRRLGQGGLLGSAAIPAPLGNGRPGTDFVAAIGVGGEEADPQRQIHSPISDNCISPLS
jgi:hypothetical protein